MSDYDYVIVGAGSAGCVLANRLSDSGAEVLLVEAGGRDRSAKIKIPAAFAQQFQTKLDWDYASGPEPGCEGRSLYVPRGRALGGSSSMNAMLYVRGHRADYDGWRDEAGCAGWGWEDLDLVARLQIELGLRRSPTGSVVHLSHGDEVRALGGADRAASERANFSFCLANYNLGHFLGTYTDDVAVWEERLIEREIRP